MLRGWEFVGWIAVGICLGLASAGFGAAVFLSVWLVGG
jgi:hypothetical protein